MSSEPIPDLETQIERFLTIGDLDHRIAIDLKEFQAICKAKNSRHLVIFESELEETVTGFFEAGMHLYSAGLQSPRAFLTPNQRILMVKILRLDAIGALIATRTVGDYVQTIGSRPLQTGCHDVIEIRQGKTQVVMDYNSGRDLLFRISWSQPREK